MESVAFLEACRTCACFYVNENSIEFVHLFQPPEILGNEMLLIRAELEAWQLQVLPDDGLPQRICANCFNKFSSVIALRQECLEAQTRLLDAILSNTNAEGAVVCTDVEDIESIPIILADQQNNFVAPLINDNNVLLDTNHTNVNMQTELTNIMPTTDADINIAEEPATIDFDVRSNLDLEEMIQSNIIKKTVQENIETSSDISDTELYCSDDEQEIMDIISRSIKHPFTCQYCYASTDAPNDHLIFANDEALSEHFFDVHDPNRPFNCPHCSATFRTSNKRENHVHNVHIENVTDVVIKEDVPSAIATKATILKCIYCNEQVRCSTELHELNCNFEADWTCSHCATVFYNTPLHTLREHERTHEPNKEMHCRLCNRHFELPYQLALHEKVHFKPTLNDNVKCDECNEEFSHEYALRRHKTAAHTMRESTFFCNSCDKGFSSSAFYDRHQMQFHPKKDNANSCANCDATFSSAMKLRNHIARSRDENGHCVDPSPYDLRKRSRRLRKNGVYVCHFCAKRFSSDEQLLKHIATHNPKERPLECTECNVRCRNTTELQEHMHVAHLQNLTFKEDENSTDCKKDFDEENTADIQTDQRDHTQIAKNETCLYFTDESQEHSIDVYEETVNHDLITASHEYLSWSQIPLLDASLQQQTTKTNQSQHFDQPSISMSELSLLMETTDDTQAEQYLMNMT